MKSREQLEKEIAPLQAAINKLRDTEAKKDAKALVGRCFKYRNSYGAGRPDWWYYVKVVDSSYWPITFSFQDCKDGRIEIKIDKCHVGIGHEGNGYIAITRHEFEDAWRRMQRRITRMRP